MGWKKNFQQIKSNPVKAVGYILGKIYHIRLFFNKKIKIGKAIKIIGWPIIDIRGNCSISIGENVLLNSINRGYFAAMFSPVKLFVDNDGAAIRIGNNTRIHGSCFHAYNKIEIGNNCLIAGNTIIVDSDGHDPFPSDLGKRLITEKKGSPVIIEDNVWIGLNCIILKGVRIGEGSIIGAGSVVREDIPPYSVALGNPAKVVKRVVR